MTIFGAIGMAGTGMTVTRKWMDAISDNLANASTVTSTSEEAFRTRYVVAQEMADGGVQVAGVALGAAEGRLVHEPDHPLADADGYVRYPDVDMASQMTQLIMAQRGYQANAAVVSRATESYQAALQIGRS
ncbi:flagellar basal-body rod protein FlgC [Cellulomonas sp. zg-ZUI222]|uniref:Flagellar basal-body rod protein FlgC n=1 Tax=Cellulomonas wangleii TaxID=2816956 RepID=A0ABX8D6F9_9CELL|nr:MULTISPECIES: flagellar basal body rod C-terminal domain-containing protein [Cellulomonas]MBO0901278.1 flagellar basal-body rod protein FlgC [Cellulomonas sp. zg-ZUI22]MBO0922413.1 flagellar basal-body rod protein FlgC [Cellulomonas wangleii]MBO0924854.1 flagellar basal-body rod protein FlgC [Cellulomonas wangleii]QVI63020.1 flagellar basal-body rod protein FlgC [Cellulomonas wangleii]